VPLQILKITIPIILITIGALIWFLMHLKQTSSITNPHPCNIQSTSYAQASDSAAKRIIDQMANGCQKKAPSPTASFDGSRYSFSYPSDYQVKNNVNKPDGSEAVYLARPYHGSNSISIDYFPFSQGLAQYPSIKYRRLNPKVYSGGTSLLTGLAALTFVANGPDIYERSIFATKGGLIISIALSSNGPGSFLDDDFSTVVATFKWK
jgi:hypothetical protein